MKQNTPRLCNRCNKNPAMETSGVCPDCYLAISREMTEKPYGRKQVPPPRRS